MSLENRQHEHNLPPQAELLQALTDEHRQLVLLKVARLGIRIASWKEFEGEKAKLGAELLLHPDSDVIFDGVAYGNERPSTFMRIEQNRSNRVYPISILGSSGIQLITSGEVFDYAEAEDPRRITLDEGAILKEVVDSRAKYLDIRLIQDTDKNGLARIFIAPDIPAVAVHYDDMYYVAKNDRSRRNNPQDSYSVISRVEKNFGIDAVEYLNADKCRDIIGAIKSSRTSFINE